jgi:hypothetical protein
MTGTHPEKRTQRTEPDGVPKSLKRACAELVAGFALAFAFCAMLGFALYEGYVVPLRYHVETRFDPIRFIKVRLGL